MSPRSYTRIPIAERLARKLVVRDSGCIEWTGATTAKGYGQIGVNGKTVLTHRLAWGLAHPGEPLPPVVRHFVCDNPPCSNPEHLRPGTKAENSADMVAKGRAVNGEADKTHCSNNHLYDAANTYVDKRGWRVCLACRALRHVTVEESAS